MSQILGNFTEKLLPKQDSLELYFTPSSRPMKERWKNHILSADFVADYVTRFFPFAQDIASCETRIQESKGAVNYIANELLENTLKFNDNNSDYKIKFGIHIVEDQEDVIVVIVTTNSIKPGDVNKFTAFIQELLSSDLNEMYVRQVEKGVQENTNVSGLGLLTMMNDYSAQLGWKLETVISNSSITTLTTMVQFKV